MPTNNTGQWSTKEKALFEKGYKKWGPNWKEIADIVKTRNNKQVYSHSLSILSTTQSTTTRKPAPRYTPKGRVAADSSSAKQRSATKKIPSSPAITTPKNRNTRSSSRLRKRPAGGKNSTKTSRKKSTGQSSSFKNTMYDDDSDSDQDNDNVGLLTGEIELGTLSPRQRNRSRPTRKKGRSTSKQRQGEHMPELRLSQPKGGTATDNSNSNSSDEGPDLTGDYGNVALLLLLYTLQGIPMGLTAAVSLVLSANNVSLTQQNMFALVSWPFSLKLLWAPIVDAVFVPKFGRRKTWLIPTQLIIAGTIVYASPSIETWMASDALNGGVNDVFKLTCVFFMLFLMCATQDICVDGWALTLLQKRNVGYASTCNAIGQTLGNALAYIGWNVLTKYTDVTFGTFMMVWGVIFASVTVGVMLLKQEKDVSVEDEPPSYREAYKEMMDILKIPLVQKLILLLITCKVGFSSEAMSQIMMTGTVGMPRGDWVSLVLFLTVPSLIVPKLVERYTTGARPFDVFMKGVPPRILLGFATALVYMYAPTSFADDACTQWTREEQCVAPVSHPNSVEDAYTCTWSHGNGTCFSSHGTPEPSLFGLVPPRVWRHRIWYLSVVVIALVMTFLSNAMFVAQMSLFAKISDPRIGGTYMTLLNTVANLGSKWSSQAFRYCTDKADKYLAGNDVCAQWNDEMSCHAINRGSDPANDCGWSIMEKNHCTGVRWKMQTEKHEGFYVTLVVFSLFGLLWIKYVKKDVEEMQNKPLRDWHVHKLNEEERESVEL